jgi:hypothetical protein
MAWLSPLPRLDRPEPDAEWKERIANITKHRDNLTGVSPTIYAIDAAGRFSNSTQTHYEWMAPYLPPLKALGLDIIPLIGLGGGMPGLQRLLTPEGSKAFIDAAVETAVSHGYDGYNWDVEARGGSSYSSWKYLLPYAKPYLNFLDQFADAMHAKNKTLSADMAGCCDWFDTANPTAPAGHCAKGSAFAHYEFVATTCADYAQSRLDRVYAMSTYSDSVWNATSPYGPELLKTMANNTIQHVGIQKYGLGFKGGWHSRAGEETPGQEATAMKTIAYLRDVLGIHHAAHWNSEPMTQSEWDAWGFFLHGDSEETSRIVHI